MHTYDDAQDHLSGLLHGADVEDIENLPEVFERAAANMLSIIDPIETIRIAPLSQTVHDDVYNYTLPSDFKLPIDLYPQGTRNSADISTRTTAKIFDLGKAINSRQISIEASEGTKYMRINWRGRSGTVLNKMDSLTANGTWSTVGTASSLVADSIYKVSGSASLRFNVAADNDGIQNTTMTVVDLTDEDEVADIFVWMYFPIVSALTGVSVVWGNDLTTKYWTSTAQTTQADGTAFRIGWNLLRFAWSTATETGTVAPATIDSFKILIDRTAAISGIRADNIIFSIGRPYDLKYYSSYIFKNSAGTWINQPTTGTDTIALGNDAFKIFLEELVIEATRQIESANASGDKAQSTTRLNGDGSSPDPSQKLGLYAKYKKRYPSQAVRQIGAYGSLPFRGRWRR